VEEHKEGRAKPKRFRRTQKGELAGKKTEECRLENPLYNWNSYGNGPKDGSLAGPSSRARTKKRGPKKKERRFTLSSIEGSGKGLARIKGGGDGGPGKKERSISSKYLREEKRPVLTGFRLVTRYGLEN